MDSRMVCPEKRGEYEETSAVVEVPAAFVAWPPVAPRLRLGPDPTGRERPPPRHDLRRLPGAGPRGPALGGDPVPRLPQSPRQSGVATLLRLPVGRLGGPLGQAQRPAEPDRGRRRAAAARTGQSAHRRRSQAGGWEKSQPGGGGGTAPRLPG